MKPREKQKRCIIVAGMHRSGTSALTRMINLLGADIAKDLMPAVAGNNERGFWEPASVVRIHDEILASLGSSWHDPFPLREDWLTEDPVQRAKRCLAEEVKRDFEGSDVFVVKDPRIPRLLPLWLEMLHELEIVPIVAITVRNPLEVARSLEKRDGFSLAKSLLLYIQSNLDGEFYSRGCERLFVSYEHLLDDWHASARRITATVGLNKPREETASKINEYLTAQLRHNRFSRAELAGARDVARLVTDIYDCLERAAEGSRGEESTDFDRLRTAFLDSCKLFFPLVQSERLSTAHQLSVAQDDRAELEVRFKSEVGAIRAELEIAQRRSAELEQSVSELAALRHREELLELPEALSKANERLSKTIEGLSGANEELITRLSSLKEDLKKKDDENARLQLESIKAESALPLRDLEIGQLNQMLSERAWKIQELETQVDILRRAQRDFVRIRIPPTIGKVCRTSSIRVLRVFSLITNGKLLSEFKARLRLMWEKRLISSSSVFDSTWYLDHYPDVAKSEQDPALHYLRHGARELRNPGPMFDTKWYLDRNPDVSRAHVNPLVHYLRHGGVEGRDPNQLFDSDWYLNQNPDVQTAAINPLVHYVRYGSQERRDPGPSFQNSWYRTTYADLPASYDPLAHYLQYGRSEGRSIVPGRGEWTRSDRRLPTECLYGFPRAKEGTEVHPRRPERKFWTGGADDEVVGSKLNIVFVSYGPFDCNSGGHIAGFANALVERGHNVIVCADGDPGEASGFGKMLFRGVSRAEIFEHGAELQAYFRLDDQVRTLVHCWTPREIARQTTEQIARALDCPYLVHLEDNEQVITRSQLGISDSEAAQLSLADWDIKVPRSLSHPVRASNFLSHAIGVTVIIDALEQFVPDHVPLLLLQPGIDFAVFRPASEDERLRIRQELGLQPDSVAIVYPGNMHAANAREMFSLYTAIQILNRRGKNSKLVRTGTDHADGFDIAFQHLKRDQVLELGRVDRSRVIELLQIADIFVQPGSAGPFNDFRLPAKVPEFMSMGRPVILPATNVGLQLRNREDALLLGRGDGVEIADRVCEIIESKELARKLGKNARRFARQNFDWSRAAHQLESFYRNALNR